MGEHRRPSPDSREFGTALVRKLALPAWLRGCGPRRCRFYAFSSSHGAGLRPIIGSMLWGLGRQGWPKYLSIYVVRGIRDELPPDQAGVAAAAGTLKNSLRF